MPLGSTWRICHASLPHLIPQTGCKTFSFGRSTGLPAACPFVFLSFSPCFLCAGCRGARERAGPRRTAGGTRPSVNSPMVRRNRRPRAHENDSMAVCASVSGVIHSCKLSVSLFHPRDELCKSHNTYPPGTQDGRTFAECCALS